MGCECSLDKLKNEVDRVIFHHELSQKINNNDILLKSIIQIQSVYRSYIFRKRTFLSQVQNNDDDNNNNNQEFIFYNSNAKFKTSIPKLISDYEFDIVKLKYPPLKDNIKALFLPNVEYTNDNSEYLGEWDPLSGKRHGRGIQKFPNGAKYEGYFQDDQASLKGKLTHPNNDTYEGGWKNGKADGYGVYSHNDGARYEGKKKWKRCVLLGRWFFLSGGIFRKFY